MYPTPFPIPPLSGAPIFNSTVVVGNVRAKPVVVDVSVPRTVVLGNVLGTILVVDV